VICLVFTKHITDVCRNVKVNLGAVYASETEVDEYSASCCRRLRGLVVRVPGYRSRGPRSIPGATRFSKN
jgi:hypothetical protein